MRWFPAPFAPLVRGAIYALLDEPLIAAFGFPRPSPVLRWVVPASLRLRGLMLRFALPRTKPRLRTAGKHPSYPAGYTIETLGPDHGEVGTEPS